ncbi:hypothetical protein Dimus_039392 [Dionaea muscipula]
MPMGVAREVEMLQTNFLWGGSITKKKIHLVKWEKLTYPKNKGGLGIRSIKGVNICLLFRWFWKFSTEKTTIWGSVVRAVNGLDLHCCFTNLALNSKSSIMWKDILKLRSRCPLLSQVFFSNVVLKVGNGQSFRFWKDHWLGGVPFMVAYPRLFSIAANQNASLADYLSLSLQESSWRVVFRRLLLARL